MLIEMPLRASMADIFSEKVELFGPGKLMEIEAGLNEAERQEMISRQKEEAKINAKGSKKNSRKDICKKFSKAVTSGTRYGSGKIVFEFYDDLVNIYGGNAATAPLPFGVCTNNENDCPADDNGSDMLILHLFS